MRILITPLVSSNSSETLLLHHLPTGALILTLLPEVNALCQLKYNLVEMAVWIIN